MDAVERRIELMKLICKRRYETIANLASELSVSERTVRRDVDALTNLYPIYTQTGRYGGGVYVIEGFYFDRMYFNDNELCVMNKILYFIENNDLYILSNSELNVFRKLISDYTKPTLAGKGAC